jgi:hypothetical protein
MACYRQTSTNGRWHEGAGQSGEDKAVATAAAGLGPYPAWRMGSSAIRKALASRDYGKSLT